MKSYYIFLLSIILFSNCTAQNNNLIIIEYVAETRGSSISLTVNSTEIVYSNNTETKKIEISENLWKEIKGLVLKIELNSINNLTAPSNESHTDRALSASLSITKNGTLYESSTFDHGNPPSELKDLINKLFEIVN